PARVPPPRDGVRGIRVPGQGLPGRQAHPDHPPGAGWRARHRSGPGRCRACRRNQPAHPARARRAGSLRRRPHHRRDRRPALPLRRHGAKLPVRVHPEDRGEEPRRGAPHRLRARLAVGPPDPRMKCVTSSGYLRYPHIHGDLLVFVSENDVWLAPADGGRAWRLSADSAQVSYPRFSRDGARIAWTSWRDGNPEAYTADPEGNDAGRLTYWSDARTRVTGWTREGEVLAVSATGQPETYLTWAYAIPLEGAPPRRLPFGPVTDLALEETGTALLTGRMNTEPAFWKRYRGGTRGRLWTATGTDPLFTRVLSDLDGQLAGPMLIGGRLFFLSDHEGTGNIYSCALDGSGLARHTDHDGMYARNPATDGQRIVYHVAGDIWILDSPEAAGPRKLEVTLGSPAPARTPRLVSAEDHLGGVDCDQTGQASVVEVRGTVHWLTHKDGPARALHVDPAARARLPRVLGETGQAVWVTDADGADALEIAGTSGDANPVTLAAGQLGDVMNLAASPDGATVAAAARDGRLLVVDVASGQVTELAASDDGAIGGLTWSPDSAWLAWAQPVIRNLARIRIARVADRETIDVTDGRFADS